MKLKLTAPSNTRVVSKGSAHSIIAVDEKQKMGRCKICGVVRVYSRGNGRWRCSVSMNRGMKKARLRDPERYAQYARENSARYRSRNLEKTRQACRDWRKKNPERQAELCKRWYEENFGYVLDYNAKRRAEFREAFVEFVDRQMVYERDEGICGICNRTVSRKNFHVDHIIPLAKGGLHMYENVQIAHPRCNHKKHANLDENYAAVMMGVRR